MRWAFPVFVLAVVAAGLVLRWPAIDTGFGGEDTVQIAMLRGQFPAERSPFDLFRFGDVARDGGALADFGYHPWWTSSDYRLAMFRPLSSGLIALDWSLFGDDASAHHLHSALWWVTLVAVTALVFRRLFSPVVAALALVLVVIHPAFTAPFAWLANRSALVAATFGFFGLWLHLRSAPTRGSRVLEAGMFTVALLGGEYALGTVILAVASEIAAARAELRDRARALLPVLGPAFAVFAVRGALGFGVRGSGYYLDALESPFEFAKAAVERVPVLAADAVLGIPATWFTLGSPWRMLPEWERHEVWRSWHVLFGAIAIGMLFALCRWIGRRVERDRARTLWWLAAGALASLVPAAGALPQDRVLVTASIALAPVWATAVVLVAQRAWALRRDRTGWTVVVGEAVVALGLLAVHGPIAARRARWQLEGLVYTAAAETRWALDAEIPDEGASGRRILLLAGADFTTNANLPWVRLLAGHPLPRYYRRLSGSWHVHELIRVEPHVLDMSILSDDIDGSMAGSLYRPETLPVRIGDRAELEGMSVLVQRIARENPWRVRYTFDRSLDDPSFLLLHSTDRGLVRIPIPEVGSKVRLPRPHPPRL